MVGLPKRLANDFRKKIAQGDWAVGSRVPSTRELAVTYGVSVNTIQTAFRELEADDLIARLPRVGGYVKNRHVRPAHPPATTIAVIGPQERGGGMLGGE